ncbi:MAG: hypothetical protein ABW007_12215 [Chitinophagaceae bacterium]
MRLLSALVFVVLILSGCRNSSSREAQPASLADTTEADRQNKVQPIAVKDLEKEDYGHLGRVIGTIEFSIPDTSFESGYQVFIRLDDPGPDLARLPDADQLMIAAPEIQVAISYPLKKEFIFKLKSDGEFTKGKLVQLISEQYHRIYKMEERAISAKTIPPKKRKGAHNRNDADGDFGIWGHALSDLILAGIRIHQTATGEIILSLDVES